MVEGKASEGWLWRVKGRGVAMKEVLNWAALAGFARRAFGTNRPPLVYRTRLLARSQRRSCPR